MEVHLKGYYLMSISLQKYTVWCILQTFRVKKSSVGKAIHHKMLVFQISTSFLIRCILKRTQRHMVDFWRKKTTGSIQDFSKIDDFKWTRFEPTLMRALYKPDLQYLLMRSLHKPSSKFMAQSRAYSSSSLLWYSSLIWPVSYVANDVWIEQTAKLLAAWLKTN